MDGGGICREDHASQDACITVSGAQLAGQCILRACFSSWAERSVSCLASQKKIYSFTRCESMSMLHQWITSHNRVLFTSTTP